VDADRFDAWTKAWISTPSRRTVLRLVAGGTLGGRLATTATALIGSAPVFSSPAALAGNVQPTDEHRRATRPARVKPGRRPSCVVCP